MNILVTGANGYIGRSLVSFLKENNHVVYQLNNSQNYYSDNLTYGINLLDNDHIGRFIKEDIQIDVIIHTASKMASSNNIEDLSILYDNIKMYEYLAIIAERYNPIKFINLSSIAVYPNENGIYNETSKIKPSVNGDALYGLSKFSGENILDFKLRNSSIIISHLRVSQVFSDDMRKDRLYIMMKEELENSNQITVFGNGERVSNFISKSLLIEKILFFIDNNKSGIFNIGDKNMTYKDFASYVISVFGNNESTIVLNQKGLRTKSYINLDKFNKENSLC